MAGIYEFIAYDVRTRTPIATVPLSGVSWSEELLGDGSLTGTVPAAACRGNPGLGSLLAGRTSIAVKRDNGYVGEYLLVKPPTYGPDGITFEDGCLRGWLAYWRQRLIAATFTRTATDQLTIARDLATALDMAGNMVLQLDTTVLAGVVRDREYPASQLKNAADALLELAQVDGGFEFAFQIGRDTDGGPRRSLLLAYPQLGRSAAASGIVLEYPGNVSDYGWDGGDGPVTTMYGVGAGDGDSALRATATNPSLLAAGWPVPEDSATYSDVTVAETLAAHARADADARAGVPMTPAVVVRADNPPLDSYGVGDGVLLRITDDCFGGTGAVPDVEVTARVLKRTVQVPDSGTEQVALTLSALVVPL